MTSSERTMIATLQGIVNNHCSHQIYTLNSSQPDYQTWLNDLKIIMVYLTILFQTPGSY